MRDTAGEARKNSLVTLFNGSLHGFLLPISKPIQIIRTRHREHIWKSKDKLISDVLQRILTHGHVSVVRPARTHLHRPCANTGYSLEDLLEGKDDRVVWRDRERERESQGNSYRQCDLMMMMMMMMIIFAKGMNALISTFGVKYYHYCSRRIKYPKKVDMTLNGETKPNEHL